MIKQKKHFLLYVLVFVVIVFSMGPNPLWFKPCGGIGDDFDYRQIIHTFDKGYLLIGQSFINLSARSFAEVRKVDFLGNSKWQKPILGIYYNTRFYCAQQTADSGYILLFTYPGSFRGLCLSKILSNGDTVWAKCLDTQDLEGKYVQETSDSGYLLVCKTSWNNGTQLIKTDKSGEKLWTKPIGMSNYKLWSVKQTKDKGYILSGIIQNGIWLIKLDSLYDSTWAATYSDDTIQYSSLIDVLQTNDSGFIFLGVIITNSHSYDASVIRFNTKGEFIWANKYGGITADQFNSVKETKNGDFLLAGKTSSFGIGGWSNLQLNAFIPSGQIVNGEVGWDAWIMKINSSGDSLWSKTYGDSGNDCFRSLDITSDGQILITGDNNQKGNYGKTDSLVGDGWIMKLDTNGNKVWNYLIAGIQNYPCNGYTGFLISDTNLIVAGEKWRSPKYGLRYPWLLSIPTNFDPTDISTTSLTKKHNLKINTYNKNSILHISYSLENASHTKITLYNSLGRLTNTLINEFQYANTYSLIYNISHLCPGVYCCQVKTDNNSNVTKFIHIK